MYKLKMVLFLKQNITPEKYDRFSTYELITYEGFHSTEIKGKPQLVYSCLTNNICFEPSYVDHDYDKMTMISGVTRTPYGKFNIVETDTFEYHNHSHNAFSRYNDNDNTPSYEEKMLNSFLSLEETFNNALEASMVNTTDPEKELAD